MKPFYAKKILFNITKTDLDRMDDARGKLKLTTSDFIRQAIRAYVAEQMVAEYIRRHEPDLRG
jgi:metal-responsive CopG/Arc/MetJ family transcriptional regulator